MLAPLVVAQGTEANLCLPLDHLRTNVARHDDDGVAEVDRTSLCIGQTPILHDLEKNVEHLWMGLLNFVEQDYCVASASDCLGKLATLFIADVARRCPGKARNRVPLHVFRHVKADHRVF